MITKFKRRHLKSWRAYRRWYLLVNVQYRMMINKYGKVYTIECGYF